MRTNTLLLVTLLSSASTAWLIAANPNDVADFTISTVVAAREPERFGVNLQRPAADDDGTGPVPITDAVDYDTEPSRFIRVRVNR